MWINYVDPEDRPSIQTYMDRRERQIKESMAAVEQVKRLKEQVKKLKEEVDDTREALIACTVWMETPKMFKRSALQDIRKNARSVIDRE